MEQMRHPLIKREKGEPFMKNKKKRLLFSLAVSLAAVSISAFSPREPGDGYALAWWGTLYPRFCFSAPVREEESRTEDTREKVKISFWLAKAFDWC